MRMHVYILAFLSLTTIWGCSPKKSKPTSTPRVQSDVKVIKNAKIFLGPTESVIEDGFLIFKEDKILKITKSITELVEFEDAQVLDGQGKTIIPKFLSDSIPEHIIKEIQKNTPQHILDQSGYTDAQNEHDKDKVRTIADDLILLVNWGLSPVQALTLATAETAKALGQEGKGILGEGKDADFIVINGDIISNIHRIHFIYEIWEQGRVIMRDEAQKSSEPTLQDL